MTVDRIILYFLAGVFVAQSGFYYPNLPEIIASHFDAAGAANGWLPKYLFLLIEFTLLLFITLFPLLLNKFPDSTINLPNREYWLAAERRAQTFGVIRRYFEWFSIILITLFIAINQLVFKANINQADISAVMLWLVFAVFLTAFIVWMIKFNRQFRKI